MVNQFFSSNVNKWELALPASPSVIVELRSRSGLSLPTDYLEFLRQCNGGSGCLDIQPYYLRLWSDENLVNYN